LLQKYGIAASKHQKEILSKVKVIDSTSIKVFKVLKSKQTEINKFEEPLRGVDDLNASIMQCNDTLKKFEYFCDFVVIFKFGFIDKETE
jgi:hypothetical protein